MADDQPTVESLQTEIERLTAARDEAVSKRNTIKQHLNEIQSSVESERQELEALRQFKQEVEEKRQVEAGDFEAAKQALSDKLAAAEAKAAAAEQRFAQSVVESAFRGASDLFGPNGLTTLTPDFAYAGMGRQVEYVPGENGQGGGIVVKDLSGEVIRGDDGRPADFQSAMSKLIDQWPGKDQILRSGQKAGSGSTGGSGAAATPLDRAELVARAAAGDPGALAQLRASQPQGRTVHGAHWDKLDAATAATSKG